MTVPKISVLSFDIVLSTKSFSLEGLSSSEAKEVDLPFALVKALVDGNEPLRSTESQPFDALTAILYGVRSGECFLYTCSCGVPGCAGLHEGVLVSIADAQVTWAFPSITYRKKLQPPFVSETLESVVLTFQSEQYFEAFKNLTARLHALAADNPHLQLSFDEQGYGDPYKQAFSASWPGCQKRAQQHFATEVLIEDIFREVANLTLKLETPSGTFALSPEQWRAAIYAEAPYSAKVSAAGVRAYRAAAALRDTPAAFLKSIPWNNICKQAYYVSPSTGSAVHLASPRIEYEENSLPLNADSEFLAKLRVSWCPSA
jgi:hypothetical protein